MDQFLTHLQNVSLSSLNWEKENSFPASRKPGMEEGESTKIDIPVKEAYGESREDLIINVPKDQLPEDVEPEVGMQLQVNQPDGQPVPVRIAEISDDELTLDANHPLAGKDLSFEIEVVEVKD